MRPQQQGRRQRNRGSNNNNNNRNRNQNPLSRSYESNGPDVKIRGNPQTIADKYTQMARDALSSGDTVMAENYFQHAEHYIRIIMAATPAQPQRDENDNSDDDDDNNDTSDNDDDDDSDNQASDSDQDEGNERSNNNNRNNRNRKNKRAPQHVPAPIFATPPPEAPVVAASEPTTKAAADVPAEVVSEEKPKKPRAPRKPRAPKEPVVTSDTIEPKSEEKSEIASGEAAE